MRDRTLTILMVELLDRHEDRLDGFVTLARRS